MIRILFDTNVILDRLLAREPFASEARDLWQACEDGRCIGYVAPAFCFLLVRNLSGHEPV